MVDIELAFGTGTHDGHGAFEHVVELRNLVEAHLAHEAAEGRDARVVVLGEGGTRLLGVDIHGAEFVHAEGSAVVADALLGVEDGARGGEADDEGGDEVDRGEDDHGYEGEEDVGKTLDRVLPFGHETVVDDDEGGVEDGVLLDGADDEVAGVGGELDDEVGAVVEVKEDVVDVLFLGFFDGDDDLLDMVLLHKGAEVVERS